MNTLPEEIIAHIYDYADFETMRNMSSVSKHVQQSSAMSKRIYKYPVIRKKRMLPIAYLLISIHVMQAISFAAFIVGFALLVTNDVTVGIILMAIFGTSTICFALASVAHYTKYGFTWPSKNEYTTVTGITVPDDKLLSIYGTCNYDKYVWAFERVNDPVEKWNGIHGIWKTYKR